MSWEEKKSLEIFSTQDSDSILKNNFVLLFYYTEDGFKLVVI
jgi:hypothetical protein